ncbi:MAG: SCO family protein [Acidobacteria bacterium]|nr:SCO family protein [Acidobacteriota bacterium]
MRYFLLILFSFFFFTACQKAETRYAASLDAKHFILRGKVVAVDKAKKKVTVAHEEIKNYMEAMTMDFPVKDDFVLNDLTKDADIRADLIVDKDAFWLENFSITAAPDPNRQAVVVNEDFAQIGREVPDFRLTNQDGKSISFKDFRGKALAITFIYTRCPLPEYCSLMSRNFSDLVNQLQSETAEQKSKIRLLSISFDPQTDTPQKLKEYGLGYLGKGAKPDFTIWQLATAQDAQVKTIAEFFGLRYETDEADKTQIKHSLRTIVIAPDGKVRKIFSGNEWTTDELYKELYMAAVIND